jgi:bifunctional DNA-binding transcriptional regulator/antitoxin component of YhaV-PrlF toxin-antitoxin module
MATLTITAKGQVTLKREVLRHLGLRPGDRVEVELLPGAEARVRAERPALSWSDLRGRHPNPRDVHLTVDEMNEVIARGWASEFRDDE